jgi:hypothetical protein
MSLKCSKCGKVIDSLPTPCGYSIAYDDETNEWGCYMNDCGFIAFSEYVCADCCDNRKT